MSDWTDEMQAYEERNREELMDEFEEKYEKFYGKLWYEFVSEKFFSVGLAERLGVNEDGGEDR